MTAALAPRHYQLAQHEAVERLHAQGIRSVLVEAATGTGKTFLFSRTAARTVARGQTVLVVAHRRELLDQAEAELTACGLEVGVERGPRHAGPERVVVASVQTMRGERLAKFPRDAFDLIIIDECHHAAAPSYGGILAHFHTARVLGVTATTDRADGKPLSAVFQAVAHRYGIAEAIADKFLVPVRGIQVTVPGMDLSKVRQRRQTANGSRERPGETVDLLAPSGQARVSPLPNGKAVRYAVDLHPGDLGQAVIAPAAVEGVVIPTLELAGARRTIVFAVDRKHAAAIAGSMHRKRPGCVRVVHGAMPMQMRKDTLAAHRAGEFQFLINVMLLTEGYNDPAIECVVMARPTQSRVLYSQAVGRALRLFAGKTEALLLDFVGVGLKFNLVGPEDVLGSALAAPVQKFTFGRVEQNKPAKVVTRVAQVAPQKVLAVIGSAGRVSFSTKVVELVRGTARGVGGWVWRMFGGK